MTYNFNKFIDRRGTNSYKWDTLPSEPKELLSVWVADMDFKSAPEIQHALQKKIKHGIYGYTFMSDDDFGAVLEWIKNRHGYEAHKDWLVPSLGVVCAMNASVDELSKPGDKIVIMPPIYPPFFDAAEGREVLECPLVYKAGKYQIDYRTLEDCFQQGATLLLFCNPHNPVGRAWGFDELTKLGELCDKYNVNVISDDIHCDLILPGNQHTSVLAIDSLKDRSVVLISSTKTFNIAGLQIATAIIPNEEWRTRIYDRLERYGHYTPNLLAIAAQTTAYHYCAGWLDELLQYIKENMQIMLNALNTTPLKTYIPEATYLMWIDCRDMGMKDEELLDFFITKCGIYPNSGKPFDAEGFIRINVAAPKAIIKKVAENIRKAF